MGTKKITLVFMGDIMPGGVLEYAKYENDFASQGIIELLNRADFRIATLESAIGENLEFDKEKMEREDWRNIIYSHNHSLKKLEQLNINLVSVANNHIFDLGEDGLRNTLTQLEKKHIKHVGANLNDFSTQSPTIIKIHNKTIAFLAYMPYWWEAPHPPSKDRPGINLFYLEKVISDIKAAKQKYDFVFVLPHWGIEYTFFPTERERLFARQIIDAGADGILRRRTEERRILSRECSERFISARPFFHSFQEEDESFIEFYNEIEAFSQAEGLFLFRLINAVVSK